MAPIELDLNSEQYVADIIPSRIVEAFSVIPVLANRGNDSFEQEFADSLYKRLSAESREFVGLLSGLRFPGAEFFGFFLHEGIYTDFDRFVERVRSYSGTEFVYLAFDRDMPKERIERVRRNEAEFADFLSDLCCHLWKGKEKPIRELLYNTEQFKMGLLKLLREIYQDEVFRKITDGLSGNYNGSAADIRKRLQKTPPLDLAREIKGRYIATDKTFRRYFFFPSYFLNEFNIAAWDEDLSVFMLFYNIKANGTVDMDEINGLLSTLKSLSDATRLQILQRLRSKPSYGKKLAEELQLSTASISRQLDQLRSMNLITEEKMDGFKYFKLNSKEIDKLVHSIQEFFSPER